jgi:flagellar basal-body rod protein FlgB
MNGLSFRIEREINPGLSVTGAGSAAKIWRVAGFCRETRRYFVESIRLASGQRRAWWVGTMLDPIAGKLEKYLDLLSTRQKLVAANIANADTPGYRTADIDFQAEFAGAAGFSPRVVEVGGLRVKNDGNNVSLDREARLLAENALRFQSAASLLRLQIQGVRAAIKEGQSS